MAERRRCATYTRKSSEEGLEQDLNSHDAQREACEAYIRSQVGEGWTPIRTRYDDGGYSGGNAVITSTVSGPTSPRQGRLSPPSAWELVARGSFFTMEP